MSNDLETQCGDFLFAVFGPSFLLLNWNAVNRFRGRVRLVMSLRHGPL